MGTFSDVISIWSFAFILPALWTGMGLYIFDKDCPKHVSRRARLLINMGLIHTGLLISICISHYLLKTQGGYFPWHISLPIGIALISTCIGTIYLFKKFGTWYFVSAAIQQLTLLSVAAILLPLIHLGIVLMLVVPIFAFGHWDKTLSMSQQYIRIGLLMLWGVFSIYLFYLTKNPYIPIILHTICGMYVIRKGLMYPEVRMLYQKSYDRKMGANSRD